MLSDYDVVREAEAVLEQSRPPYWDAEHLRLLLEAAWDQALADNFRTTSACELRWWSRALRGQP